MDEDHVGIDEFYEAYAKAQKGEKLDGVRSRLAIMMPVLTAMSFTIMAKASQGVDYCSTIGGTPFCGWAGWSA